MFQNTVTLYGWMEFLYQNYQSYLKIERGLSKILSKIILLILSGCLFLTTNGIEVSPIQISEETVQQFIYSIASEVNARSQARIISGLKASLDI
jgi:integrase/recombinase XerD